MRERLRCEFSLIRYVPDVVKGEFANIGVVLRGDGGQAAVRFTRNWSRVRCLDPDVDTDLLENLETELATQLSMQRTLPLSGPLGRESEPSSERSGSTKPILEVLGDTLSNSLQMTEMRATLAESFPAEMEQLLRMYVEPLKRQPSREKSTARVGRAGIQQQMRTEFERAGVWGLLRKKIPVSQYGQPGDPLKIDCGYRNGKLRLFQAVSLDGDAEAAKGLAYSFEGLQRGVASFEGVDLELTAVVEPITQVGDGDLYAFGVKTIERERIRVLTVTDLGRVAETARRELR